jgi:hypothetical protein
MPDAAEKPARPAFFIIFSMKKMEPLFSLSVLSFFYSLLLFLWLGGVKNQML